MSENDLLQRAKLLIDTNRAQARELYGRRDSPVIQFPVGRAENGLVDLGLTPCYRQSHHLSKTGKRHRPAPVDQQSPDVEHAQKILKLGMQAGSGHVVPGIASEENALNENESGTQQASAEELLDKNKQPTSACTAESLGALVQVQEGRLQERDAISDDNALYSALAEDRPTWRPPWKMFRGISGHLGWVRSVAVDASNEWFATGSADRTVKIWDLASGRLRLTLTGHISTVRGIAISPRHPYMFTVGEDKTVKCWDLEQNKVIRNYHGHLSGVYCLSLHPSLDILMTGGRDSTVRVWDIRTRSQIFVLGGHRDTVNAVFTQAVDPQIVSASVDSTIRTWDLAAGKCSGILTNHKKGVRALVRHPREFSFASASADNIKTWALPNGSFMRNLGGQHHEKLINALAVNDDGVLVSGGDDGKLCFWDYAGAHCFQTEQTIVQPGSLDCEAGIFALAFDHSGSRLITCEADKTIKMWKEDTLATEETFPLHWKPHLRSKRY